MNGVADSESANAFRILNPEPFDLSPANVLVLADTAAGFTLDVNNGSDVQVTGEFQAFDIDALEAQVGYDLNEAALTAYDITDYAIVATSVVNTTDTIIYDEPAILAFESDPGVYADEIVTVSGSADIQSAHAFEIIDTVPFSISIAPARFVVVPDTRFGFRIDINNGLAVTTTGTLIPFDLPTLEARLGHDLNNAALADYGAGDYALIADTATWRRE